VHSYEDCSLWQFEEARRLGKACLYDMPIGYYPWWEAKQKQLVRRYADWLPADGNEPSSFARPAQKQREMELADLVLAPSAFVEATIREFHPDKKIARACYGVDLDFWRPAEAEAAPRAPRSPLQFLYAGRVDIRKGIPPLIEAWSRAGLKDAELVLVGTWNLAEARRASLPAGVSFRGPKSQPDLRSSYQAADVFVFASFFEGLALALLEAMACGLPVIASEVVAGMDLVTDATGHRVRAGEIEPLVEALRWFSTHRERLPDMKRAARATAERFSWENYRRSVSEAVSPYV
jgi:glycosyltransferase involved in cell wall biosynthesis